MSKPKKSKPPKAHSDERSYPNPYINDPEPPSDYKVSSNIPVLWVLD